SDRIDYITAPLEVVTLAAPTNPIAQHMNASLPPARRMQTVRGACPHDCPDTCALVTTVVDGIAIRIQGAADHPPTNGVLCTKVARYLERTYSPGRLQYPLRRVGRKGEARFERITWEAALDAIASRL